jgi:ribosomal protein S18 acetylase RimI-like enzyme
MAVDVWSTRSDEYLVEKKYGVPVLDGRTRDSRFAEIIKDILTERPEDILVSEVGGEVVGFISFSIDEESKLGTIGYNAVKDGYRGKGIGTTQLTRVLEIFKQRGTRYARVYVWLDDQHAPARRMYEKCGFKPLVEHTTLVCALQ